MNKSGGGSGCLIGILGFCCLAGNIILLSGGLSGDLADNSIAHIVVVLAIIADIALVGFIIKALANGAARKRAEHETAAAKKIKDELQRIVTLYSLYETAGSTVPAKTLKGSIQNADVNICVKEFKKHISKTNILIAAESAKISSIMNCPNCHSDEAKLNFLQGHIAELDECKNKIESLKAERRKQVVVLSEEDDTSIKKLRGALVKLRNSKKKKNVSGISMDEFFGASKPQELEYFSVKCQPIILQMPPYTFCLYPSVILAFDINGIFVSALNPEELHIKVEHIPYNISVQDGSYSSDIIDSDSKCIRVGDTLTTWQHTKVNGGPDLRYSYNPRIEYRVDQMEYGQVKFALAGIEATYAVSSHAAIEALEEAASKYCIAAERVQNPVPALLGLVNAIVTNKDTALALQDNYSNIQESQKLYCYISRA